MRTIISFAVAIFIHLSLFYFLMPKNEIPSTQIAMNQGKYSTIDLTKFNVHKNPNATSRQKYAAPGPLAHETLPSPQETARAGISISSIADTSSNSAESGPIFISFEQPEYPKLARLKGLEGKVKIKVFFNHLGVASNVEILESSTHPLLDDVVKKTALRWGAVSKKNAVFEKTFEFKLNN